MNNAFPFVHLLPHLFGVTPLLYVIPGAAIIHFFTLHQYLYRRYTRTLY